MQALIHHVLYSILYGGFLIFEFLLEIFLYYQRKLVDFIYKKLFITNDLDYVRAMVKKVTKLPSHLTIILKEERPSYDDLANIAMWSIAAGIPFISFYDSKGVLKVKEDLLEKAIDSKRSKDVHILWHRDGKSNNLKNGVCDKKICVRILSPIDGRDSIVDATKQLTNYKDVDIDQNTVKNCLNKSYVFPDPNLGIYFHQDLILDNYPPWQLSNTEFLNIHSHHNLSVHRFISTLYRFSKIEQRFGK